MGFFADGRENKPKLRKLTHDPAPRTRNRQVGQAGIFIGSASELGGQLLGPNVFEGEGAQLPIDGNEKSTRNRDIR